MTERNQTSLRSGDGLMPRVPAPWFWRGNVDVHTIRLSAPMARGEKTMMDLVRWGFQRAKPRFRDERHLMVDADTLVEFEVLARG